MVSKFCNYIVLPGIPLRYNKTSCLLVIRLGDKKNEEFSSSDALKAAEIAQQTSLSTHEVAMVVASKEKFTEVSTKLFHVQCCRTSRQWHRWGSHTPHGKA